MARNRMIGGFTLPNGLFTVSLIRSVQYGSITVANTETTQTATITAVDVTRASLVFLGCSNNAGGAPNGQVHLALTNSTTVTATRGASSVSTTVAFCVIEYQPQVIRRVQRGTIAITAGNTTNTAAITSVNTAKSVLSWLGQSLATGDLTDGSARLTLTSATVVTATREVNTNEMTVAYQVLEWR